MRPNRYFTTALLASALLVALSWPASAQYGTGEVLQVPQTTETITIDGLADEAAWDDALEFDLVQNWEAGWVPGWGDANEHDIEATGRLLFSEGTLYLHVRARQLSHPLFFNDSPYWEGSQLIVGVDLTHQDDNRTDGNWTGWPDNAPNQGVVAYKMNAAHPFLTTFDFDTETDPEAEGWIESAIVIDGDGYGYSYELAIHGAEITSRGRVGFNISGAVGAENAGTEGWHRSYAWFLYSACPGDSGNCRFAGGVADDSRGYVTLQLGEPYGTGETLGVPLADGPIVIDGSADDAAWEDAAVIDLVQHWEAGWVAGFGDANNPEASATARLLFDDGTLYMHVVVEQHNHDLFFNPEGDPWQSSQLLVGLDLTYDDDNAYADDWTGWPENAPNLGAVAYKINPVRGVTLDWGLNDAPDPMAEGWVDAAFNVDEDNRTWEVELAFHGAEIVDQGRIGFNISGAVASDPPGHEWGWFLFSACEPGLPAPPDGETRCAWAGGVQSDARGFMTLDLGGDAAPPPPPPPPPPPGEYGTGEVVNVNRASSPVVLDGVDDDPDWELATFIDLTKHYDAWGIGDPDDPDVIANARLLWREGVLYAFIYVEQPDHTPFFNPTEYWKGSTVVVGVDLTHANDHQTDSGWGGWPGNAPDKGPVAYKINPAHPFGFTLNWSTDDDPVDLGYVDGVIVVDEENNSYVIEMAIFGDEITERGAIGFNMAGSVGSDPPGEEWGWFAYSVCELDADCQYEGGLMADARGYVSLYFPPAEIEGLEVPRASSPIAIDGTADEAAWEEAVEVDLTANWNSGYYAGWGDEDVPDIISTAKLLWDEGTLYVFIHSEHAIPMLFMPPPMGDAEEPSPGEANQILVGVDLTNEGRDQIDGSWSGWPWNAPNHGPVTYKINPEFGGITLNWGYPFGDFEEGVDPIEAGFVDGVIVVNEDEQWWSIEMAIHGDEITEGGTIGFNVGGAASDRDMCDAEPECTYAWFSWQAMAKVSAGGDVMRVAETFAPITFVPAVSGEDGPATRPVFALDSAFPNPFRSQTTVVYSMERDAVVQLSVFDVLGRRVSVLEDGPRAAGEHRVRFDANGLASGMYILRLAVDGQPVATRAIMRIE